MLDLRNYTDEMEDIEPGDTLRVCHTTCEAGEDTRSRLYITRTLADPNVLIAYCHNCQQGGRWKDTEYADYRDNRHVTVVAKKSVTIEEVDPPKNMVEFIDWPVYGKSWAYQRGLKKKTCGLYHIQYDPSSDRIYLPRADFHDGHMDNYRGYQLRALNKGSKYTTVQKDNTEGWSTVHSGTSKARHAIIVEDLCSAIVMMEAYKGVAVQKGTASSGYCFPKVYVNHGTKVDPVMMHNIAREYKHATVWLDNDSQHVDNQAKMMLRTIAMYNPDIDVRLVRNHADPKNFNQAEIVEIIREEWLKHGQY